MEEISLECIGFRECVGSSNTCQHQYEISSTYTNLGIETSESNPKYSIWHNST